MVRTNCDYVFLQPIYNKTQREVLWDLEAAFMDKREFSELMDTIIERQLLEGNTPSDPKKKVRIMVCADFEDSSEPTEKFFHWSPVAMDMLPAFRLCAPKYWEERPMQTLGDKVKKAPDSALELHKVKTTLEKLF